MSIVASAKLLPSTRGWEVGLARIGASASLLRVRKKEKPPAGARGLHVEVRSDYGTKDTIAPDRTSLPEAWITAMPLRPFC